MAATDWRSLVVAVAAPGWRQLRSRRLIATVLLAVGVAFPVGFALAMLFSGRNWVALSLDRTVLAWLVVVLAAIVITRLVAAWGWLRADDRSRRRWAAAGLAATLVTLPCAVAGVNVVRARSDIAPVFTPTADDAPLFDADGAPASTVPGRDDPPTVVATTAPPTSSIPTSGPRPTIDPGTTTTTVPPPLPARPRSGVDPALLTGVHNVLLLGGDAGPGRFGLRTDTMMIFSLDVPSGRASLVSLPRDMRGLLFPPGSALEQRYPYGFTKIANAVYPTVSADRSLRGQYEVEGIRPGVVATAEAIGYSLDVTIHDYVLVDMQGFIDLVDALGGVTVRVTKAIPMPGNVPGARTQYPDTIGPGVITMDGTTALGFVRSRYADSDFQRTARQRQLLAALAQQVSFGDVVSNFGPITSAVGGTLRTSLTPDELAEVLAVIGGETAIVESVGLVPPLVSIRDPDFQKMAEVMGAVQLAIADGTDSGY